MNLMRQLFAHAGFAALTLWLLAWVADWYGGDGGALSAAVGGAAGFVLGFALAHLAHEWSHYAGALLGGMPTTVKANISPLFFDADLDASSGTPFLAMSFGGPIGNIICIALLVGLAPLDNLVFQAALAAGIGSLVYVLVLEVPVSRSVLAGKTPIDSLTDHFGQGGGLFLRATAAGLAASAGSLLVI